MAAASASASTAQEEQRGSQILRELESGELDCGAARADDFELVGDYAMGRMLGSTSGHEAMDEMMTRMMGADGERQAHIAMGRRYAGCGGGQLPAGFGQMMGAINGMGMMGAGGQGGRAYGEPGSMMYGNGRESNYDGDHFDGPSAAAMVGMMAVLIGAVAVAVLWLGRRRHRGPLDTLEQRFAAGELSAEEYQESKRLLEGS
ncbi:MAG: SHOCT domain-containing protein [Solirubrobacterales bacterium]